MFLTKLVQVSQKLIVSSVLKRGISSVVNRVTIETDELAALMKTEADRLAIFNATLTRRDYVPRDDHVKERIPGSLWFDLKGFSHPGKSLQYMMPPEELFIKLMKEMDVRKSDLIVVYDKYRMISAPRAYWMLKTFGATNVYVLNGTFEKWQKEGRPIDSGDNPDPFKKHHKEAAKPDDFDYKIDSKKIR